MKIFIQKDLKAGVDNIKHNIDENIYPEGFKSWCR